MTNVYRNEVTITLNEHTYLLRPTFSAMVEIEDHFKETLLLVLSNVLGQAKLTVKQQYFIIAAGIKGAGGKVNKEELEFDITQAGTVATTGQVATFLAAATQSADTLKKN